MARVCPRCGRSSNETAFIGSLCKDCYVEVHGVAKIPSKVHFVVCKYCGKYKYQGGWNEPSGTVDETLRDYIELVIARKGRSTRDIEEFWVESIDLDRSVTGPGIYKARVVVAGRSGETIVREERIVEAKVDVGVCPDCTNRITKRGYNAIVQIRSSEGRLGKSLRRRVEEFIAEELSGVLRGSIIGTEEHREGFDILISDPSSARMIASKIRHAFMGRTVETWKLVGRRQDGKRKGRLTILVRIPDIDVGDFIEVGDRVYYYLAKSRSGGPVLVDLESGRELTVKPEFLWDRGFKKYNPEAEARRLHLLSRSKKKIMFLDSENGYEVVEFPSERVRVLTDRFEQGKTYRVLVVGGNAYVLGEESVPI
ncbi:MAG: hypothetical protein F7C34_05090 [Desulfurococcales archaeon]|nr:hypothetical protein [Desulfurococcales archaeon]